ncbi:MAG: permease YjgP/YjgQ family protein [Gemmatimonadetes bacterium]|nr:permease YjgP/YjgQ family protein [Gemmatimonadota bacterium]
MKIITRYVLKEHVGPFVFALSALTSLLLLQYIARRFGDLVGKGLSWNVITEFLLLSIPFTLAMTLPMAMLVAVLYAFSRLASENEITALKAGGVSTRGLMVPAVAAATVLAIFMLWFNDQVLPRANHELATLQVAILRTKPTFALRPQVINTVKESQYYLRAGQIDEETGLMKDVTIYDVNDNNRRRTIYADSGMLALTPNMRDLSLHLFKGWMLLAPTNQPGQVSRVYYKEDLLKVRDVGNQFQSINADTASKGDREMSVCEMQRQYEIANASVQRAHTDSLMAVWRMRDARGDHVPQPGLPILTKAGGIGAAYCSLITKYFHVQTANAAEVPKRRQQPESIWVSVNGKSTKVQADKLPPNAYYANGLPAGVQAIKERALADSVRVAAAAAKPATPATPANPANATTPTITPGVAVATPPGATPPGATPPPVSASIPAVANGGVNVGTAMELSDAHLRLDEARYRRNRAGVEIQKKFSLAFACIVFVLVGAPLAVRFPRGGVGLVIGASFLIFAIYYIGLIGGESLANKNIISPFWAMWADNIVFFIAGLLLMTRMGREGGTGRGGGVAELLEGVRARFARLGRRVGRGSAGHTPI